MSVAEIMIANSFDLMWSGPFLMYVSCLEDSEVDEVKDLIGADC